MSIFKGVSTALVTPFDENNKVNYNVLEQLINSQIENGINGLVICGTTGESPTVTDEEKDQIFKVAKEVINGRVPFIAGTGTNNTEHVLQLTEMAAKRGADAVLINNPYYNKSSDEGIYKSYEYISDKVDIPIIVYNVPSRTGKNISASLAIELTKIKNVKAFKEASGDLSQVARIMKNLPEDVELYSGNDDQIMPVLSLGGDGVISTCSNIIPKECVEITDSFFNGDIKTAIQKQLDILPMCDALFCECNPIPVKTAMKIMGLNTGDMRLPLTELTGSKRDLLEKTLKDYSLI